jgi:hypothetical protein
VNGQLVRDVRTLLARRQPTLVYLIVLAFVGVGIDLLVAQAGDQLSSFSSFSRREFDEDVLWHGFASLDHASAIAWIVVLLAVPVSAVVAGWLRATYLIALAEGRYSLRAPRTSVLQLSLYSLAIELLGLGTAAATDHGQGALGLVALLVTTPFTFYTDYAIVLDEVSLVEGVRRSVRMFRLRTRVSVLAVIIVLFLSLLLEIAFANGFTDSTHVQPTYLVAWELVSALFVFVTDVVLVTLYRGTRLGFSAAGSAGSAEAPSSGEPSD